MKPKKTSLVLSKFVACTFGPKLNYRLRYFHQRKHFPNLKHPKDLSEILIANMFDEKICSSVVPFVDKIAVRDYVCSKGLDHILLENYGVWNTPEEIPFDLLPDKFILKSNNGCGHHVICRDKSKLNKEEAIRTLNEAIRSGREHVEQHYRKIEPKVFCEELIDLGEGKLPVDYKFTCIGGEVQDIFVASERAIDAKYSTWDMDWNPLPYTKDRFLPKENPERPELLDDMIAIAKKLSEDFVFVRVDLYEHNGNIYFSELTFFPWGALLYSYTDEAIKMYGKKYLDVANK